MEYLGSIDRTAIPLGARRATTQPGVWTKLAERVVDDHRQERITVVKLKDLAELRKLRHGIAAYLRQAEFQLEVRLVDEGDTLRAFLELQPRLPKTNIKVVSRPPTAGHTPRDTRDHNAAG